MASPADGMILDNDNSRDGAASVASMTPAPSRARRHRCRCRRGRPPPDPTRPPHLCQPCVGDDDGTFLGPGPGRPPVHAAWRVQQRQRGDDRTADAAVAARTWKRSTSTEGRGGVRPLHVGRRSLYRGTAGAALAADGMTALA